MNDAHPAQNNQGTNNDNSQVVADGLLTEVESMYLYARKNGFEIPPAVISKCSLLASEQKRAFTQKEVAELSNIHQQLNKIIAPATPLAVMLMETDRRKKNLLSFLGAVPLVRNIMLAALLFLIMFVAVGQLQIVNEENVIKGILENDGWNVVAIIAYLVSCAGLGACFSALFKLNGFISNATYDPRFDSTYWASILLGIIAGLFISELLYGTLFSHGIPDLSAAGPGAGAADTNSSNDLGKPFLALLGGFSANMVYKVMQRVVDTVESLFKGDPSVQRQAQKQLDQAGLQQKQGEMQIDMANSLMPLADLIKTDPDKAKTEINNLIGKVLSK